MTIFDKFFTKKRIQVLAVSGVLIFFVAWVYYFSMTQIAKSSRAAHINTLQEVVEQQAASINYILLEKMHTLEMLASFFYDKDVVYNDQKLQQRLSYSNSITDFDMLFFATPDGESLSAIGEYFDVTNRPFFETLQSKKPSFTAPDVSPKGDIISVCAVPVINLEGEMLGVLGGTYTKTTLDTLITESFTGGGYAYLFSRDGLIVAETENASYTASEYDLLRLTIKDTKNGMCEYKINGVRHHAAIRRLDYNDLTIVSVAPETAIASSLKKIILTELIATVASLVIFIIMLVILVILNERHTKEMLRVAYYDTVTGGRSLQKFHQEVEAFLRAHPKDDMCAICFDINDFRVINDLYGFEEGNKILKLVFDTVTSELKTTGLVCRVSIDMFYVLMRSCEKQEELKARMKKFENTVNAILEKMGKRYHVTFTFGIYLVDDKIANINLIFERANHVHNRAKKVEKGNTVVFYQERFRENSIKHKLIENTMRTAFDNREFKLFLQPKYEMVNKTLVGAEALIRWESNKTGKRSPDEFIPVFEKTGFIIQVDLYMMEKACQILRQWMDEGLPLVPISVNQSKLLLTNPLYFNVITSTIERYGVAPELIEVEVTETIMYENADVLNKLIDKLHAYGIRIAIDDFGSGYSSLILLRDIKADVLKIDKEFIYHAEKDDSGKKILSTIIQLADSLGMAILAEGIETKEQAEMLTMLGCHEAQGYLYGKPMEVKDFVACQHSLCG